MGKSRRRRVWERAGSCCEYCQLPQEYDVQTFQLDHIRAQKHSGPTTLSNLSLSCLPGNAAKGPNIAGFDPKTNTLQPLFNPRKDQWPEHFAWSGPILVGRTPIGRTTILVLGINQPERVEHRRLLILAGSFNPSRS